MSERSKTVILANGQFPEAAHCLEVLENAERIVCCDGAVVSLLEYGLEPEVIIGDLDSVPEKIKARYNSKLIRIDEQETNDLTKAVNYCHDKNYGSVTILGATGLREDHSLGNISLLLDYNEKLKARILTDHGEFSIISGRQRILSTPGEKFSFFSVDNQVRVTSEGLKYPMKSLQLHSWWRASLNEATGDSFMLIIEPGVPLIMFRLYG